jgi:predicted Rossmann-fold nucleotide-binding protein
VKNSNCIAHINHYRNGDKWWQEPQQFIDSLVEAQGEEIISADKAILAKIADEIANLARKVYFYNPDGRWDSELEARYNWYSERAREAVWEVK